MNKLGKRIDISILSGLNTRWGGAASVFESSLGDSLKESIKSSLRHGLVISLWSSFGHSVTNDLKDEDE